RNDRLQRREVLGQRRVWLWIGHVVGEGEQLVEGAGLVHPLEPVGELLEGQPPCGAVLTQHGGDPLPIGVRGPQPSPARVPVWCRRHLFSIAPGRLNESRGGRLRRPRSTPGSSSGRPERRAPGPVWTTFPQRRRARAG